MPISERYNVYCWNCGRVWQPVEKSALWHKAKRRVEEGYLDALAASAQECGCQPEIVEPEAPYRVVGYNEMCEDFDLPFDSLVAAARTYLELAKDWSLNVCFVRKLTQKGKPSKVELRLWELARNRI